jgi:hypothetical protein
MGFTNATEKVLLEVEFAGIGAAFLDYLQDLYCRVSMFPIAIIYPGGPCGLPPQPGLKVSFVFIQLHPDSLPLGRSGHQQRRRYCE